MFQHPVDRRGDDGDPAGRQALFEQVDDALAEVGDHLGAKIGADRPVIDDAGRSAGRRRPACAGPDVVVQRRGEARRLFAAAVQGVEPLHRAQWEDPVRGLLRVGAEPPGMAARRIEGQAGAVGRAKQGGDQVELGGDRLLQVVDDQVAVCVLEGRPVPGFREEAPAVGIHRQGVVQAPGLQALLPEGVRHLQGIPDGGHPPGVAAAGGEQPAGGIFHVQAVDGGLVQVVQDLQGDPG